MVALKQSMNSRIVTNPKFFGGIPYIQGADIPIHLILNLLAAGLSFEEIISKHPKLTEQDISAVIEFALLKTRDMLIAAPIKPTPPEIKKESQLNGPLESDLPSTSSTIQGFPPKIPEPKRPFLPTPPLPRRGMRGSESRLARNRPVKSEPTEVDSSPSIPQWERDLKRPRLSKPDSSFRESSSDSQIEISAWNKFVLILDRIKTFLVLITKTVLAVFILTLFSALIYFLISQKQAITILPFENVIGFETSETVGEGLANQLIKELERIQHFQKFSLEEDRSFVQTLLEGKPVLLPPATEPLKITFRKAESLKVGSFKVPVYVIVAAIQRVWGQENKLLLASLQKFGSFYSLTASLGKEKSFTIWEDDLKIYPVASENESPEEKIQKLIRILAYKLAFATLNASMAEAGSPPPYLTSPSAENGWKSYFYFSEGLGTYQRFLSNPTTYPKDWSPALDYFQKALIFYPSNYKAHFNLGLVHQMLVEREIPEAGPKTEHLSKATEAYREAIKLKSDFLDAHYQLATIYLSQKDYTHAISNLSRALELKSNISDHQSDFSTLVMPLLHLKLGEVYLLMGKYNEAKEVYQKVASFEGKAKVAKTDPTLPILAKEELEILAHSGLAKTYQASRDFNAAIREYNEILKLNLPPSLTTLAHRKIGQIYRQQGRYPEARFEYQEALRINPEDEKSHLELGRVYMDLQQYSDAVATLKEAVQINPHYAEAYQALGEIYFKQNKTFEALSAYKQALQIRPEYPEALYGLGHVYARQHKDIEAIQYYQRVLQIDPDFPEVRTKLGMIYYRAGKYSEAISEFIQVLQENSEDKWAHLGIGLVHAKQGRYPEAEAKYKEVLRINPDFAPAYNHLGQVYTFQGKFLEAIAEYEKALELDPDFLEAHLNLAETYLQQNNYPEAIEEFKKALELDPYSSSAIQGLQQAERELKEGVNPTTTPQGPAHN